MRDTIEALYELLMFAEDRLYEVEVLAIEMSGTEHEADYLDMVEDANRALEEAQDNLRRAQLGEEDEQKTEKST